MGIFSRTRWNISRLQKMQREETLKISSKRTVKPWAMHGQGLKDSSGVALIMAFQKASIWKFFATDIMKPHKQLHYDATTGGLLDKTYTMARTLDRISRNHEDLEDNGYGSRFGRRGSNLGVVETDTVTALQTQMVVVINLLQTIMMMNKVNVGSSSQVNIVSQVATIE